MGKLIGRILCALGFHTPGSQHIHFEYDEVVCGRPGCNGIYRDDKVEDGLGQA